MLYDVLPGTGTSDNGTSDHESNHASNGTVKTVAASVSWADVGKGIMPATEPQLNVRPSIDFVNPFSRNNPVYKSKFEFD